MVHDALDTTCDDPSYILLLTPMTYMGASADGADVTTFFALQHCKISSAAYRCSRASTDGRAIYPPDKCAAALSVVVKTPVDSTTYTAPAAAHGMAEGSRSVYQMMGCPSIMSLASRV